MPAINVPCPACKSSLKLPDESYVGKKAKCPKCGHRFVITIPGAAASDDDIPVLPLAPKMGTAARWVPDDPQVPAAPPTIQFPGVSAGPSIPVESGATTFPDFSAPTASSSPVVPAVALPEQEAPKAVDRIRRRKKSNKTNYIILAVTSVLLIGGTAAFYLSGGGNSGAAPKKVQENVAWQKEKAAQAESNKAAEQLSPTSGKPIALDYIPFTPHVLIHLHPAELWRDNRTMGEFRAMLGDLSTWLEEDLKTRTRFAPSDIRELTIALNFGARLAPPEVAMVVRLREKQVNFLKTLKGPMRPDERVEIYEPDDFTYMVIDQETFVVVTKESAEELADYRNSEALASPDMEPLLAKSDRDRHLSIIFDLKILDSHLEDAFLPQLQMVADRFVVWLGDEIETVSWSMHLDPNFYMETLLHNASDSTVSKVQRHAQVQLNRLGEDMLWAVRKMKPTELGARQLIGRFPAMLQALNIGTTAHVAPGCARLVTILPKHAATNIAGAAMLTWNQSLVTNFSDEKKVTKNDDVKVPDKLADRLRMNVLIDFRRTPLQEAFGYIGDSIKTDVTIDGDALKAAGFTQNMPQTFDLGTVTALAAIDRILDNYAKERDPLVLIVDEKGKKLMLSTKTKAEADGLTPFDTKAK
ncbi:MAG: hypothetical protein JNM43_13980 [Planctomycetaceae bacterium]|nr:hypothetical protein [Planctomycetaceae bacterium]